MRPANLFQLELSSLIAGTRGLLLKLGVSLLLGLPFLLFDMPSAVRLAGLTAILTFTSFFGAAVGVVRRRSEGQLQRLALLPVRRSVVLLDLLLSFAALDAAQLGILLTLFLLIHAQGPTLAGVLLAAVRLLQAVILLNVLGMALGLALRSNPEVHLFGALAAAALLALSGQIPAPGRLRPALAIVSPWNPVSRFAITLGEMAGGVSTALGRPGVELDGHPAGALLFLLALGAVVVWRAVDWRAALRK